MNEAILKEPPLAGLHAKVFLNEIWQKKPYLITGAYPRFKPLISAEELAGLACEEEVESRIVIENTADKTWQLLQGPFDEATFNSLPKNNWSLLVQSVDWWLPEAQALLEDFNFLPRWRRDDLLISYATKGGGVGPHYDHYDVFLLQASGQRHWEVGGKYNNQSQRVGNSPLLQVEDWEAKQSWTLNPGDMLYIPPGVGHNGVALDDDCMTYSIGFRAPSYAEILCGVTDLASEQLSSDSRFTDVVLNSNSNSGEISAHAVSQLSQLFHALADDKKLLAQWLGKTVTSPKYPELVAEPHDEPLLDISLPLQKGTKLKHALGARLAFAEVDDDLTLFVNERAVPITSAQRSFVADLCASNCIELSNSNNFEQSLVLITKLIKEGALEIVD